MYNYISVLNKSTAVTNAINANFLNSPTKINLILSKSNIIEIYLISKDGLESTPYINLNGTIAVLDKIKGHTTDNLFIVTEDLEYCILSYNETKKVIRTLDKGNLKEDIGKRLDKIFYAIDTHKYEYIVCCCYKNIVKVISTTKNSENLSFRIEYDDLILFRPIYSEIVSNIPQSFGMVKSTSLLENKTNVINNQNIIFSNFWIDFANKSLNHSLSNYQNWKIDLTNCPNITNMFSPKIGGLILCFTNQIKYYKYNSNTCESSFNYKERKIVAFCEVDQNRYLLGDEKGNLLLLGFANNHKIIFNFLGEINYMSSICYLDNYHIFVGSQKANSQLVKILTQVQKSDPKRPLLEVVEEYDNLAPIIDFSILNNNDANTEFLCVSGIKKHCGLKILRKGISLNIECDLEIPLIKNLFPVRIIVKQVNNTVIETTCFFVSQIYKTILLIYNPLSNSIDSNNNLILKSDHLTLMACNYKDYILQLTKTHLYFYDLNLRFLRELKLPNTITLFVFKKKLGELYVYLSNNLLLKYDLSTKNNYIGNEDLPDVIISDCEVSAFGIKRTLLVFSLWNSAKIYTLDLKTRKKEVLIQIEEEAFANNIVFTNNEYGRYLFISLSNGKLLFFKKQLNNNPNMISDYLDDFKFQRKYVISNSIFEMQKQKLNNKKQIFINTTSPSFLVMQKENPIVSSLNTTNCSKIIALNKEHFKDLYAFIFDSSIVFGKMSMDLSQNISTKYFEKQIYKASNFIEKNIIALISEKELDENNYSSCFTLIDKNYNEIDYYELDAKESCHVYAEINLKIDDTNGFLIFALGTALVENESKEPEVGRIILLKLSNKMKLIKVGELEIQGGVYSITGMNNLLYAACGSTLFVVGIVKSNIMKNGLEFELKILNKCSEFTAINEMICHNEFIVVSDLYRSITIMKYDENKDKLIEYCRDFSPTLINAITAIGDDYYLVADDDCNIKCLKRMNMPKNDEDKYKLERVGQINIGGRINKFISVKKSLDPDHRYLLTEKNELINLTYYATMDGTIGVLINLPLKTYEFLLSLQQEILKYIYCTGNLSYENWRAFKDGYLTESSKNFVDGCVIEEYLNFDVKQRQEIFKNLNIPNKLNFNETFQLIETLKKFH